MSIGSYSPTGLTGGNTVAAATNIVSCVGSVGSALEVSGFTSNPGSSWLTSITCNGVELLASAATAYSFSDGWGIWDWSTGFNLVNGTKVSCTIVHN